MPERRTENPDERQAEETFLGHASETLSSLGAGVAPRFDGREPTRQAYVAGIEARQGAYMAASGTLTQFNAIMAAIHGSALTGATEWLLKGCIASALLLHVLAAFVLCWAARPIVEKLSPMESLMRSADPVGFAMADGHRHVDDTFRNYRRGWRITLLAIAASSIAAVLFVLQSFGITVSDLTSSWR